MDAGPNEQANADRSAAAAAAAAAAAGAAVCERVRVKINTPAYFDAAGWVARGREGNVEGGRRGGQRGATHQQLAGVYELMYGYHE